MSNLIQENQNSTNTPNFDLCAIYCACCECNAPFIPDRDFFLTLEWQVENKISQKLLAHYHDCDCNRCKIFDTNVEHVECPKCGEIVSCEIVDSFRGVMQFDASTGDYEILPAVQAFQYFLFLLEARKIYKKELAMMFEATKFETDEEREIVKEMVDAALGAKKKVSA